MKSTHVAVIMGGLSAEREVSLSSGKSCSSALKDTGFQVSQIDVDRSIVSTLQKLNPDVVLNVLHGSFGEDGLIQSILEFLEIPYTHSGVLASALSMDKMRAKQIVKSCGVPVCPSIVVNRFAMDYQHPMSPPYVIKPLKGGSSLGIMVIKPGQSVPLDILQSLSWNYGDQLLIEQYIDGIELSCGVMGDTPLAVTEIIVPKSDFYSYELKYLSSNYTHVMPAKIPLDIYKEVQRNAVLAHHAIGCRGISRSDFLFDPISRKIFWLEINVQPGMTPVSIFPEMAMHAGYSFQELLLWMVEDASCLR
ncbi:D-alanine--D-alanine ligase [Candidatus Liberibacter africanus]|uniref:D-alanine--D-alanine ligase n=1 Tax=Liberibacter africanus TaxID=34020 RepID=UPI0013960B0D|nr:D-alanine--D-alanine ligase [Candidatus Liberibacter africanus]QTP64427.1 D-alanine--D-alanine ligase [Candidatus Liberibacter africanus]